MRQNATTSIELKDSSSTRRRKICTSRDHHGVLYTDETSLSSYGGRRTARQAQKRACHDRRHDRRVAEADFLRAVLVHDPWCRVVVRTLMSSLGAVVLSTHHTMTLLGVPRCSLGDCLVFSWCCTNGPQDCCGCFGAGDSLVPCLLQLLGGGLIQCFPWCSALMPKHYLLLGTT